jgi:protein-arginine kinase activator protein McsA
MAKTRQNRYEAEHSATNQFVKKVQNEQAKHAGRIPNLKGEAMEFNAYMCNNGEHAQELAKDITKGIDAVAFPVKP